MRIRGLLVALTIAIAILAGCTAGGADAPPGTAHGHVVQAGGPGGAPNINVVATVLVTRSGRRVATAKTSASTEFSFSLAPGKYRFTPTAKDYFCVAQDVTITSGADITIDLVCPIK